MSLQRIALAAAFFMLASFSARSGEWGAEHPEARKDLIKVLENHDKFRDAFVEWATAHPKVASAMVQWVSEKEGRTVVEYVKHEKKEKDEEHLGLLELEKTHIEGMKAFREWIHQHPKAAVALMEHPDHLKGLARAAEKRER